MSNNSEDTANVFIVLCILVVLLILARIIFTSGRVDYCYIEHSTGETPDPNLTIVWKLKGYRSLRSDRDIGRFETFDDAIEAAHKLNCKLESNQ